MGKDEQNDDVNLFQLMLDQADGIDFSDPAAPDLPDPTELMLPGLEVSKLFCVAYWALLHSQDEEGITAGSSIQDEVVTFYVDMRRDGKIIRGSGPAKPKPDCVMTISDRDMVRLALGQLNPQVAFMKGRIKVKGNIMLGLRMQTVLMNEVKKMSRVAKL
ncbi:uncharacterized protein UHOD_02747 [Ustilago sp. UG-2017b]|nr:uncharacterized protein UHOD_02747 [Ustilago sp. UG-2017b]